jgi:predicted nucleic acid-binding protein
VILVDTSVWVDHLRRTDAGLVGLLREHRVSCHPFVIGELACGRLQSRQEILNLLAALPPSPVLSHEEAIGFLHARGLAGTGVGWVDVHLLGSAVLGQRLFWTRDGQLAKAATRLRVAFDGTA